MKTDSLNGRVVLCEVFIPVVKPAPRGMFKVLAASVLPLNINKALLVRVQELTSQLCRLLEVPPMG